MRRAARRFLFFVLALGLALSLGRTSRADEAVARQRFKQGVDLYDRKLYAPALEEFRAAYHEKPSPGIKQNIALCLKGLGKPIEAATAFDEALDEGEGTLKPATRAAIEQELAELSKTIATVRIKVIDAEKHSIDTASVSVDGTNLPPGAGKRPIRLMPGIHVFAARVAGYPNPPDKKLALERGAPVDATFEVTRTGGSLTVKPNESDAVVRIDGTEVGSGLWTGNVLAGPHKIEVSKSGFHTTTADVVVESGASMEYPVTLRRVADVPEPYKGTVTPPSSQTKKFYAVAMGEVHVENLRLSPMLGEPPDGTKRDFAGGGLGARAGFRTSRFLAVELLFDFGLLVSKYKLAPSDPTDTETKVVLWQLTPMVRFTSPGKVRFTTGTGFGLHSNAVDAKLGKVGGTSVSGSRLSTSWMLDFGAQFDTGPVFFEPIIFFDVNGIGSVRSEPSGNRLLESSPGVRVGIRLGLGVPF